MKTFFPHSFVLLFAGCLLLAVLPQAHGQQTEALSPDGNQPVSASGDKTVPVTRCSAAEEAGTNPLSPGLFGAQAPGVRLADGSAAKTVAPPTSTSIPDAVRNLGAAIRKGDTNAVRTMIEKDHLLVSARDAEGNTALDIAVIEGQFHVVKLLLDPGADLEQLSSTGHALLVIAAGITDEKGRKARQERAFNIFKALPFDFKSNPPEGFNRDYFNPKKTGEALKGFSSPAARPALPPEQEAARLAILRLLIERGAKVNDYAGGMTPLHMAAGWPNRTAVEILIGHGADPEARVRPSGHTPLHLAAAVGSAEVVQVLLAHKANVNAKGLWDGQTALIVATMVGDLQTVRILLDHGALLDTMNQQGATALYAAALTGNEEIFKLLLEKGADPAIAQLSRQTVLHAACTAGNRAIVETLLARGAALEAIDSSGFTPLLNAVEYGHTEVVKLLLARGANPKVRENRDQTALYVACNPGNVEIIQTFLDLGLDVNASDKAGRNALANAVLHGHLKAVTLLLSKGAKTKIPGPFTMLMEAAHGPGYIEVLNQQSGRFHQPGSFDEYRQIAELLLARGENPAAASPQKRTALHFAAQYGNVPVLELLLARGVPWDAPDAGGVTPLIDACGFGLTKNAPAVELLLARGANISATNNEGNKPIHLAAAVGKTEVLTVLLKHGADPRATGQEQATPLHTAIFNSHSAAAEILLQHGASVRASDAIGQTPLHVAAAIGDRASVRLLLEHQAPIEARNNSGMTPLHQAVGTQPRQLPDNMAKLLHPPADKLEVVRLLLARGADPLACTLDGQTPAELAAKIGTPEIVAVLQNAIRSPRRAPAP